MAYNKSRSHHTMTTGGFAMHELVHQAKSVLRIYLQRGEEALTAFAAGDLDLATSWLKRRTAAFYNFRVIDQRLSLEAPGVDLLAADPEARGLLVALQAQEQALFPCLEAARTETLELANKLRKAQQLVARYRSHAADTTYFEQSA